MPGVIKKLVKAVGDKNVLSSRRDLLAYSYDATQRQEMPEAIVFAESTSQVSEIIKIAYRERVPVVPRGAGTGISGGTVPIKGGIVLELSRMNRIIAIDIADRRAIVEPGVINLDLQNTLAPLGFMYPPDPASQKSCTLGGNIGENAGGPLCFQYGVTSKYVCGIEAVLPDGDIVEFGARVDDSLDYDLRGLLIGSEGTLAIATRLVLHILPLPESLKTMLAIFDTLEDAGQAVSDIIGAGFIPASLELMDRKMCWAIEQSLHAGYPTNAEGVLLIEVSGLADGLDRQVKDISEICRRNRVREICSAKTIGERDALWKGRKGAFGSVARLCPPYLVNDGTVPRNKLVPALLKVQEISAKYGVEIANVAHAGDGNLHPLILFDRNNPEEVKAARKAGEAILDTCLALGGTISGEHGIGLEKLTAMPRMFSAAELTIMRQVKRVFDPDDILNPGKLLPAETATSGGINNAVSVTTSSQNIHERLTEIVGTENVKTGDELAISYQADGIVPELVVFPTTAEKVSEIIREGNIYRKTIVPRGSGSKQNTGPCLTAGDIVLNMKDMKQIIDLDTGNCTVCVGAGLRNSELQEELTRERLFFPLEPIGSEDSTIGGELAANASGPRRFMYGTARDLVLGMTVVTPTGDIIHPGGKTMKNVAGLDLVKMFIGSRGTLGVITEAVLRLLPLPEAMQSLCLKFPGGEQAFSLVSRILNSVLWPASIELIDQVVGCNMASNLIPTLHENETMLLIDVTGSQEVVARHLKEIETMARTIGVSDRVILESEKAIKTWNAYRQVRQSLLSAVPTRFMGKASVPLSKTSEMYQAIKEIGLKYGLEIGIMVHCGNGILYSFVPAKEENAFNTIDDLKQATERLNGFFTVEEAPMWLRKNAGIWHRPGAYRLMERLKKTIDPANILNPGKLVEGHY